VLSCLFVDGVVVSRPGTVIRHRKDGRPNGIAFHVYDRAASYVCNDTTNDPLYSRYFQDVGSIVAVPLLYQERSFGVISVSSLESNAFGDSQVRALEELAQTSAKFVRPRRCPEEGVDGKRPFLIMAFRELRVEAQIERGAHECAGADQGSGTGKSWSPTQSTSTAGAPRSPS
jgi:hypothetical protein